MLFLFRFKAGLYGQFYGTVDPLIIMRALSVFCKDRQGAIERRNEEDRQRQAREARKKAVTWDEFCRTYEPHNITNPLKRQA